MLDRADVAAVASRFRGLAPLVGAEPCTLGHINTTFFLTTNTSERYVLQRINPRVFPNPLGVARNVGAVCSHLERTGLVAPLVVGHAGEPWVTDEDGGVWRLSRFVHGRSLPFLTDLGEAQSAGRAFARFGRALAGFDGAQLVPAIEHFHDLSWRLRRLDEVLAQAPRPDRFGNVVAELAFVGSHRALAAAEKPAALDGVIHGDCKVNNLIFDAASAAVLAVVDLDTVMLGSRAWDFGDLVRSAATTGAEDDPNADLSIELFRAIATGFVHELGDALPAPMRTDLVEACMYITFMLGVRFLIDYLEGDVYFRAGTPDHNLLRARAQFGIVARMERRERELLKVVKEI